MDKSEQLSWIESQLADLSPVSLILQRIMTFLHAQNPNYHWVGIYHLSGQELVLGAFAGPSTDHIRIPVGRGVCGTAVLEGKDQVVDDVSKVGNYLACNLDTKSEMVALIKGSSSEIVAQLDIDGRQLAQFDLGEQAFVRAIADKLAPLVMRAKINPS